MECQSKNLKTAGKCAALNKFLLMMLQIRRLIPNQDNLFYSFNPESMPYGERVLSGGYGATLNRTC